LAKIQAFGFSVGIDQSRIELLTGLDHSIGFRAFSAAAAEIKIRHERLSTYDRRNQESFCVPIASIALNRSRTIRFADRIGQLVKAAKQQWLGILLILQIGLKSTCCSITR
jgi:hypothetical protein